MKFPPVIEWVIVRSYAEFVQAVTNRGVPNFVSFDHDLSDFDAARAANNEAPTERTGYDCAKWLANYCFDNKFKMCEYAVHSMNPVGKSNIESLITSSINREKYS